MATLAEKAGNTTPLWKRPAVQLGGWFVFGILWCELWLRVSASSEEQPFFTMGILLTALVVCAVFGLLYGLSLLLPAKWRFGVLTGLFGFSTLACLVQTVYFSIFDTFVVIFSAKALTNAGIGDYHDVVWRGIFDVTGYLVVEALPFLLWCVFAWRQTKRVSSGVRKSAFVAAVSVAVYAAFIGVIAALPHGDLSPWHLYWSTLEINSSVRTFGAVNALRLDTKYLLFGGAVGDVTDGATDLATISRENTPALAANTGNDHVMALDFAALADAEEENDIKDLHQYFPPSPPPKLTTTPACSKAKT